MVQRASPAVRSTTPQRSSDRRSSNAGLARQFSHSTLTFRVSALQQFAGFSLGPESGRHDREAVARRVSLRKAEPCSRASSGSCEHPRAPGAVSAARSASFSRCASRASAPESIRAFASSLVAASNLLPAGAAVQALPMTERNCIEPGGLGLGRRVEAAARIIHRLLLHPHGFELRREQAPLRSRAVAPCDRGLEHNHGGTQALPVEQPFETVRAAFCAHIPGGPAGSCL